MSRSSAPPKVTSSTLRVQRLRQRRAGQTPTGFCAITRSAAIEVRARMFEKYPGFSIRYGTNITNAILRGMHRLVREAGEQQPVEVLCELAADYRRPEHPVRFLNRIVSRALGHADLPGGEAVIELADADPIAGI